MKEKDYIEEIIGKNLEKLNDSEPSDGHFERFEAKLNKQNRNKTKTINLIWKIAAAVVFAFLAINQGIIYFSPNNQGLTLNGTKQNQVSLAMVSKEYAEVEFYYNNAINVGLQQWNEFAEQGFLSEEEKKMMGNELEEFEKMYKNLQKDLAANPNDERVINAMLEYYQAKLSVINMIVNKLKEVQQTNKNHEFEI
jgi:hypothetical protein